MTVFAAITMSGIQLLGEQPLNYRNKMIVGIALAIGIGIESVPDILQFCPQLLKNILGSSLMVSFLVVFFLNIIVPEDNREELLGDAELSGLPVRHGGPGVQHAAGQHLAGQLFCPPGAV